MTEQQQRVVTTEPAGERPRIPGYGVPEHAEGILPWSKVSERLDQARNYWVATAGEDGRPHAVPVWGLWLDGQLYFGGGPRTARNLAANPHVAIHLESGDDVVIVEGIAEPVTNPDAALVARYVDAYAAKYEWRPEGVDGYVLRPRVAYAWSSFPADATRWRFGEG